MHSLIYICKKNYMKVLLLGSGGRENALAWKLSQSSKCTQLFIAPGNAGSDQYGTCVDLAINDFSSIGQFCQSEGVTLMVVGPEAPLVDGIVDYFQSVEALRDILIIGPNAEAAQLEGSKAFSKRFMEKYNIPTAAYREFTPESLREGLEYIDNSTPPIVLKADGLAAGKGVLICEDKEEAKKELGLMLDESLGLLQRKWS